MSLRKSIKTLSFITMLNFTIISTAALLSNGLETHAEEPARLLITETELTDSYLEENDAVDVQVKLAGNLEGFYATSFGIKYDPALTLTRYGTLGDAGRTHEIVHNEDLGLLWFEGASGTPVKNAVEAAIAELTFEIPDTTPGAVYPITFVWQGMDNTDAYWYTAGHTNIIDTVKANSLDGAITVPDPNAPHLNKSSISVNPNECRILSLENFSGDPSSVIWFSNDPTVAEVSSTGDVTAHNPGVCRVYAMVGITPYVCTVTVTEDRCYDIEDTTNIFLTDSDEIVNVKVPSNKSVEWISVNPSVVSVKAGALTALKEGTAKIYAIAGDNVYCVDVIVDFSAKKGRSVTVQGNGDVSGDGTLDIGDAIMVCRAALGTERLTEEQAWAADAYRDDVVDTTDAVYIINKLLNKVEELPYCPAK